MRELEERVESLSLICQAMWELLRERTDATEEMLIEKVQELDMQDGKLDGRRTKEVTYCVECHRPLSKYHQRCMYCGRGREPESAFDSV
jgi:hypothetical protein